VPLFFCAIISYCDYIFYIILADIISEIWNQAGELMKIQYILLVLIIFAWPLYYLYQLQLGAISFLLLAVFFLFLYFKQTRKTQQQNGNRTGRTKKEKIKQNNR
jgi:Ca2+/Na+ antiporter